MPEDVTSSPAEPRQPLGPEETARLTELARACKAAARAVVLYPASHPAIAAMLGRIVALTAPDVMAAPLTISVVPTGLLLDGREPARPDQAIGELAALLHTHWIGEVVIHPGGDAAAWHGFLLLLGRAPESVRLDGGIARLWTTMGGRHVEVHEIDYAEVLREHRDGVEADWSLIVESCLDGRTLRLDREASDRLLALAAGDPEQLAQLMARVEAAGRRQGGLASSVEALMRLLRTIAESAASEGGDRADAALQNVAAALGHLTPNLLAELLRRRITTAGGDLSVVDRVVGRMSDNAVAGFIATNVSGDRAGTGRLAEVFQTLVPDADRRNRVLSMAHDEAAQLPVGREPEFESLWHQVASMLLSYDDTQWVRQEYDRELSRSRTQAMEVERISDDPPERVSAWLGSVAAGSLRQLDLAVLTDLLQIEKADDDWSSLMAPVVDRIEDLLLVGDAESAQRLLAIVALQARSPTRSVRQIEAGRALDALVAGPMMRHIVRHLSTMSDEQYAAVQAIVGAVGPTVVRPLAEALAAESRTRPRERLTALLLGFGATGRQAVERLRNSANAAVRRTAIHLLREFGGIEALPDLTLLLDDAEPHVQREAVIAILTIGTDEAYDVLQQALVTGTARSREVIMQAIGTVRDGRATPLYSYIVEHLGYRSGLQPVYLQAIESLGALRDPLGVPVLKRALYGGDWWAPTRTRVIREAAAAALGRIGGPDALAVLGDASATGSRGVRAAARRGIAAAEAATARLGRQRDG
jgi:HEAT repeat protein